MTITLNGTSGITYPDGVTQYSGLPTASATSGAPLVSNGSAYTQTTAVGVAFGGTGLTSVGTSGNVLTSNGTSWVSQAAAAFDAGTRLIFAQTSAPTGWTKDTTNYNNHALRVVTGAASTGGTVDFTTAFASQAVSGTVGTSGATTLSTSEIPSHTHSTNGSSGICGSSYNLAGNSPNARNTGSTGGGGSHTHSGGTFTGTAINLAVKYLDVITATKN